MTRIPNKKTLAEAVKTVNVITVERDHGTFFVMAGADPGGPKDFALLGSNYMEEDDDYGLVKIFARKEEALEIADAIYQLCK